MGRVPEIKTDWLSEICRNRRFLNGWVILSANF